MLQALNVTVVRTLVGNAKSMKVVVGCVSSGRERSARRVVC
jgi:hypothetical protein